MIIVGRDAEIAKWVGLRVGVFDFGPSTAIGVTRGGELVAGIVFHQYRHPSIEVTCASTTPRWASRDVLRFLFRYAFLQLNCRRMTAITAEDNVPARNALEKMGFRVEGTHPEALVSGTAISYGILRSECRWLD